MPILAPSWHLLKAYKNHYINYHKFKERYLNEMRHLYRSTTLLQTFAKECMQESVVLCCYCKSDEFCARSILKEIIEKIIRKLKQKVEYPIPQKPTDDFVLPQEFLELTKRKEAAEYRA